MDTVYSEGEDQSSSQSDSANSDSERDASDAGARPGGERGQEERTEVEKVMQRDEEPQDAEMASDEPPATTTATTTKPPSTQEDEATAYLAAVSARRAHFLSPPSTPAPVSYSIESIATIPHSTHIHALALPPCSSHIFTGGQDGFIRRYALHPMLNGTGIDNPLFTNLTMKPPGTPSAHPAELRNPVLVGYWENEEPGTWMNELKLPTDQGGESAGGGTDEDATARASERVRWGPKSVNIGIQSAVYSLAVQREEIFGLSGTGLGTINLFTIRHDEGQIRHVFKSADPLTAGHKPTSPVSVLTLTSDEESFLSGGWDHRILQWDLNTGVSTRAYQAHSGQVSSISFRPTSLRTSNPTLPPTATSNGTRITDDDDDDMLMGSDVSKPRSNLNGASTLPSSLPSNPIDPVTSPLSSSSSSNSIAAALVVNPSSPHPPSTSASLANSTDPNPPVPSITTLGLGASPSIAPPTATPGQDVKMETQEDADENNSDADADGDLDDDPTIDADPASTTNPLPAGFYTRTLPILPPAPPQLTTSTSSIPLVKPVPKREIATVGDPKESLGELSNDVFLSTGIDGQVLIWDRRVKNGGERGAVRKVDSGASRQSAGWCASACWSPCGQQISVGRRSSIVEIYDIRHSSPSNPVLRTLHLPSSSGSVSAIAPLPSGKHLIIASHDTIRLWDLDWDGKAERGRKGMPFKVIPGHHTGMVSQLYVDPKAQFLISASGGRGWEGASTENVVVHEISARY